jgi:hypothetical protein
MRNSVVPLDIPAAASKVWNESAEFRVYGAAVVALVVILGDDLPVGLDLIGEADTGDEICQRVSPDPIRDLAELSQEALGWLFREPKPPSPVIDRQ